nr:integrase, catalytic region, zinc finger, CCHC-type, peptidase aspartic, catalytic [Tanacetum cinerariifolium]
YAAVDSCETAQEIWLHVQQMMKGSDIGIQEKNAKLFNEWERINTFQKRLPNGLIGVLGNVNQNSNGNGNLVAARAEGNATGHNGNQISKHRHRELRLTKLPSMTQTDQLRMTLETHNRSSSAHQELYKIVKDENYPIVNQVDPKVQNFEIQLLKEAAKFVGDFKSLAKEANESFTKHKALELEIERLLRAVVSQDIMSVVQNNSVGETSNLQTELERTKERFENCIIKKENEYAKLWNDWYKKCEEYKLDKISYDKAYNDMQQKIERLQAQLGDLKGKNNTKTRRPQPRSNTKNDRVPSTSKSSCNKNKGVEVEEHHRKLLLSRNKKHMPSECNNVKLATQNVKSKVVCAMCKQCLIYVNHDVCLLNYVNGMTSCSKKQKANVSINEKQKKQQPKVKKTKKVGFIERLATPKPSKPRSFLRRNACFVKNLEGVDLLSGNRTTNLYTINLHDMASASPIFLMARASSTKSWLWHQRLSHLNFDTINDLTKNDLVTGLPKFKYHKEHLCSSCEQGKAKEHLTHLNLFQILGRVSSVRTPQQNEVVERRNRTLVKAARTMLIFSRASLFLWAEAIATAYFTQNRSIIHRHFNKTPYELINGKKPDISFLHVFGALCYPKNDREDIGNLGAKAMAFEQRSSIPELQSMTSGQISSGLDLTYAPSSITTQQPTEGELDLLFEAMYDDYIGGQPSANQAHHVRQTPTTSTSIADTTPTLTNSSSQATNFPNPSQDVDRLNLQQQHA